MQPMLPSPPRRRSVRHASPPAAKAHIVSIDRALVAAARRVFVCAGIAVSVYRDLDEYLVSTDATGRRSSFTVLDARGMAWGPDTQTRLVALEGRGNRVLFVGPVSPEMGVAPQVFPTVRVSGDYAPITAALQDWLATRTEPSYGESESMRARLLQIDDAAHEVYVGEQRLSLRPTEHALLRFFLERPHQLFSRTDLRRLLWGEQTSVELRTVDVHVMRLRKALRPYGLEGFVETVFGFGYRANHDVLDRPVGDVPPPLPPDPRNAR